MDRTLSFVGLEAMENWFEVTYIFDIMEFLQRSVLIHHEDREIGCSKERGGIGTKLSR